MVTHTKIWPVAALLATTLLVLPGCKKDAGSKEIELVAGHIHLSSQWAGSELWIESLDPKTSTCLFSQYQDGKVVEASTITLKNCRTGAGGMMRPNMPSMMPQMQQNRPNMPMQNRPGMPMPAKPGMPGQNTAAPAPSATPPMTPPTSPAPKQ
jgi:hypothetical protein